MVACSGAVSGDVTGEKHEEKCDANKFALLTADLAEVVPSVKTGGTYPPTYNHQNNSGPCITPCPPTDRE